ncbi:MAG: glycosyltransferase family 4 protein [Gluconacetobacter diazotrophicus]|nr:glycosyltransferase family 4 protein [Gluconacetobacter diazotrophicus]
MTNSPLRVLQVAPVIFPTPPPFSGGTERVVAELSAALVAAGHAVTLLAPEDSALPGIRHVPGLPSLHALQRRHGTVPPGVPDMLDAVQLDLLRREAPRHDVVHCHGAFSHAALVSDRPSLTTVHWRLDELDRQLFFRRFPGLPVAAISAAQARDLPEGNRAGIVHHGIAADRYRPGPGGERLAFVGRMTDQKRPDAAIRIARAAGRPVALAGAVDVGNPHYFRDRVEPLLGPDARHLGELDDAGKQDLLGGSAALLFPIDWPEPFGLVMIEAMACGTPVIAFDRGSASEIVEHGVSGFVVRDEHEAVAAIRRLPELDRNTVRVRFEERFTAGRMARDYVALYRRILSFAAGTA